jgi:hypothetical protein
MVQMLEQLASPDVRRGTHAEVCTDIATGSLGLVTVVTASSAYRTSQIDAKLEGLVSYDPTLEPYFGFWEDRQVDELIPTPGMLLPDLPWLRRRLRRSRRGGSQPHRDERCGRDIRRPPICAATLRS